MLFADRVRALAAAHGLAVLRRCRYRVTWVPRYRRWQVMPTGADPRTIVNVDEPCS